MQTFLPYESFAQSANCLDRQRLGKQRVECLQILNALAGRSDGWSNHPAVNMWRGCEYELWIYGQIIIAEWVMRGYKSSIVLPRPERGLRKPHWLGHPEFHAAHRSNLLRKDSTHYSQFGWTEPADLPYLWPEAA